MIVVFDTNIWKANLYLRSEASAAVKLFLNRKSAKVALPEVVKLEVEHHLRKDLKRSRDSIVNEHSVLLAIFGRLPDVNLPSDKKIEERVTSYFNESGFDIEEVAFSYEAARSSFLRTIDKSRPSHNKQQFKDGVLWEDCKALANRDEVIFVTGDKDFFEKDDLANGLAKDLSKEADSCLYSLRVLPGLADLLRDIEHPIQIDDQVVEAAINEQLSAEIDDFLEPVGFVRTNASFETTFYATEDPNLLYIEFTAEFVCEDVTEEGRKNALLRLIGDGSYNHAATSFSDLRPMDLSITYLSREGKREGKQEGKAIISGVGHSYIGHRRVSHVVRKKLKK